MMPNYRSNSKSPQYWQSPEALAQTDAFQELLEREFPEGAIEANEQDRRSFLKLMGASAALAGIGLTGCRMPERYVLPYSKQPERMIPGVPIYYATSQPGSTENIPKFGFVFFTRQGLPVVIGHTRIRVAQFCQISRPRPGVQIIQ